MNDTQLFALMSVICVIVSYSTNVGADPPDPKQKFKDTGIGSTISKMLPDGEVKDKFDKLENQDVMDIMEMLSKFYKFKDIDEFLGKMFEKNPEAANFIKLLLKKIGCSEDDATMNCVPSMDKIKQMLGPIKPMMDKLVQNKDQIMSGLSASISIVQNAEIANKIMQTLTG